MAAASRPAAKRERRIDVVEGILSQKMGLEELCVVKIEGMCLMLKTRWGSRCGRNSKTGFDISNLFVKQRLPDEAEVKSRYESPKEG